MKMEVMIDGRIELREVAYVSIDSARQMAGQARTPVLQPGEALQWVFGSTIPRILKTNAPTDTNQV